MRCIQLVWPCCSLVAFFGGVAQASVQTFHAPLNASFSGSTGAPTFESGLPLFDTQNGQRVLTGVQFGGTADFLIRAGAINGEPSIFSFTIGRAVGVSGVLPGGAFSAFFNDSFVEPLLLPGESRTYTFPLSAPISGVVGDLAQFASPSGGILPFTGRFEGLLTLPPFSQIVWSDISFQLGGSLSVTYTYEVIPTPGAAGLLALGGLVASRRRRHG